MIKRIKTIGALTLLGIPPYMACFFLHVCMTGHMHHGPYPAWHWLNDTWWVACFTAVIVFSASVRARHKRSFFLVCTLLIVLRLLLGSLGGTVIALEAILVLIMCLLAVKYFQKPEKYLLGPVDNPETETKSISEQYADTIVMIAERLRDSDLPWAITGSLGFALHGMDIPINDIDLQTSREGAYQIEQILHDFITRPVQLRESEHIQSHFGELTIEGVKVEIIAGVQKKTSDGEWEPPVDVLQHREFIDFESVSLPVLSLEYEEKAYRAMGRHEKADLIKEWLSIHGIMASPEQES